MESPGSPGVPAPGIEHLPARRWVRFARVGGAAHRADPWKRLLAARGGRPSAALIMLAAMDRVDEPEVPAWLVVVIVARESAVTILRGIALTEGIVMEAEELGKYKLILQSFAVFGLLVHYSYFGVDFYVAGMYFLIISVVVALWSGVNYHVQFFRLLQGRAGTTGLS